MYFLMRRLQDPDDREPRRDVEPVRHDRLLRQRDQEDRQLPAPAQTQVVALQQQQNHVEY